VRFSPDGKLIATVGDDDSVQVWDDSSPRKRKFSFLKMAGGPVGSLAFHPLKPVLAVGAADLRFWDLKSGNRLPNPLVDAPAKGVDSVAFSPDWKWIALGMQNGQVAIWDFVAGRLAHSFQQHSAAVYVLCFSHDGTWLASGGYDNLVVLYDVKRGVPTRLEAHTDHVFGLAFAPDDKTLVSTSWDGTIRFWSVANHQVALTLAHDGGPVTSVAFSPDGNLMATSGSDGTVRLWPAASPDDIAASHESETKGR
jgi:WD40 repeat protein